MNTLLSFLGNWQVKLLLIFVLVFSAGVWHKAQVKIAVNEAVTQVVSDIEIQSARERFKLKETALNSQIELQNKAERMRKEKNNEINNLQSRVDVLADSLSVRPNRQGPSNIPSNSGNSDSKAGATGVQLSRPDAEFLIWFARETSELQLELNYCKKQYDESRNTLEKYRKKHQDENL